jgi:protein-S-isoprenylcysteine O-methyltransferase Ste14
VPMVYGTLLICMGTALVVVGWVALYRGLRSASLVTTGVYSATRNPQYLGFILVLAGWIVGWPTVLVVVMAPVLIWMYVRLCRREERELEALEGFGEYRARVPMLL